MADADVIAALFGGSNGSSRISADLDQFESTLGKNDYWKMAAAPILGAKFNTSTWTPGQTIGTTAAQAFLGSILNVIGQRQEENQLAKMADILPQLYKNPSSVALPTDMDPEAFGKIKLSAIRENALLGNKNEDARDRLFSELLTKSPGAAVTLMPDQVAKFGLKIPAEVKEVEAPPPTAASDIAGVPSLANGRETTAKKIMKYTQEFIAGGMPATQAAVSARQQVEGEIKANTKSFDTAKEAREYAQKLFDLANTAKAGIAKAGDTGQFYTPATKAYDYFASGLGDQEAVARREGRGILGSIKPELVQTFRSPGAVSEKENAMILGAGPGDQQTPEVNAALVKKSERLGKLHFDYADFLDAYREANGGSIVGADKKWNEYRQAVPLFSGDEKNIEFNDAAPSWQEYFSGEVAPKQEMKQQRNKKTGEIRWVPK